MNTCEPDGCTLPTAERPLRLQEFADLVRTSVRQHVRVSPTELRWSLAREAGPTATDLMIRESDCCSFFTFTTTIMGDDELSISVKVPPTQVAVLDALQAIA